MAKKTEGLECKGFLWLLIANLTPIIIYPGDLSDVSDVIDSSDDPAYAEKKQRRKDRRKHYPYSSASSSDLDYSYQTRKKKKTSRAELQVMYTKSRSRDIEKQQLMDDVSMQVFNIESRTSDETDSDFSV